MPINFLTLKTLRNTHTGKCQQNDLNHGMATVFVLERKYDTRTYGTHVNNNILN